MKLEEEELAFIKVSMEGFHRSVSQSRSQQDRREVTHTQGHGHPGNSSGGRPKRKCRNNKRKIQVVLPLVSAFSNYYQWFSKH